MSVENDDLHRNDSAHSIRGLSVLNGHLTRVLNVLLIVAVAALVMDVLWGVFSRFALSAQSPWTEELARFLLVWVTMLGSSLAFRHKQHLGIDILTASFDDLTKRSTALLVDIIVLFFVSYIFFYGGSTVFFGAMTMQQTMISLPLPKAALYLSLPFSGALIVMFIVEDVLKNYILITHTLKRRDHDTPDESKS